MDNDHVESTGAELFTIETLESEGTPSNALWDRPGVGMPEAEPWDDNCGQVI
jgi:hypothetical protein